LLLGCRLGTWSVSESSLTSQLVLSMINNFFEENLFYSQSFWIPHYDILDASGQEIFKIKGPCCVCSGVCCTCDFPFEIFAGDTDGTPVGRISKQYSGAVKEMFTDVTNFSVTCKYDQW